MIALFLFQVPFLCLAFAGQDPSTLDITQALQLSQSQPDFIAVLNSHQALADQELLRRATWDNPQLEVSTEHISPTDTRETLLAVSQRIELFGTRTARVAAAEQLARATTMANQDRGQQLKTFVQQRFYQTLLLQQRLDIWETWQNHMTRFEAIVAKREQAGEVSGYDRRRLSREMAEAQVMIARDRALHASSWERLRALVPVEGTRTLAGPLLPAQPSLAPDVEQLPLMRAFDAEIAAATLEAKAASHWLLPELTVTAGIKEVSLGADRDRGYYLSTTLPLPIFDRKRSAVAKAKAQAELARAEKARALTDARSHGQALQRQLAEDLTAIENYRLQAHSVSLELVHITETAYREGEADLLALLDAYRSLRDADLNLLALASEARSLAIDFERLGGSL